LEERPSSLDEFRKMHRQVTVVNVKIKQRGYDAKRINGGVSDVGAARWQNRKMGLNKAYFMDLRKES
jgi:hypothetical protein